MSDAAFNFQTLNPDVLLDALWETGIRVESGLTALNSYENRVYQFSDDEKRRYVAKFYRPQRWRAEQIAEEHQYALDLLADELLHDVMPLLFLVYWWCCVPKGEAAHKAFPRRIGRCLYILCPSGQQ